MGRLLFVLGLGLIGVAIALMISILSVANIDFVKDIMIDRYCEPDEIDITDASRLSFSGTQNSSTVYFCEDAEGNRREITNQIGFTAVVAFLVPFLTGLLMTIGAGGMMARNQMKKFGLNNIQVTTMPDGSQQANLSPEQQATLQRVASAFGAKSADFTNVSVSSTSPTSPQSSTTLAERLQQLEDARKQGLITSAEHQRARDALLDAMDDDI